MNIELRLSDKDDAHVVKNLWPFYLHDISEFDGNKTNLHGLIGEDDEVVRLAEMDKPQDVWWREPEALFPYLIRVDGRPVGFNLIAAPRYLPPGIEADFVVHEFFLVHAFRGTEVAERAAHAGFERHRGRWQVVTYPSHARAIAFWRKAIRKHAPDSVSETEGDHPWGRKVIFHFSNGE